MSKAKRLFQKKWIWGAMAVLFFAVLFAGVFAVKNHIFIHAADTDPGIIYGGDGKKVADVGVGEGEYVVTSKNDSLTAAYSVTAGSPEYTISWDLAGGDDVIRFQNGTSNASGKILRFKALKLGSASVLMTATNGTNTFTKMITITVGFRIDRGLYASNGSTISYMKVHPEESDEKVLVMPYETALKLGTNSSAENNEVDTLNLVVGDANDQTKAKWESADESVVKFSSTGTLQAVGAGKTTISVSSLDTETTNTEPDKIDVYVTTEVQGDGNLWGTKNPADTPNVISPVEVKNKDVFSVAVSDPTNVGLSSKLSWVITKNIAGNTIFIRDSLGNVGTDADAYPEDITLEPDDYVSGDHWNFKINAKAGTYVLNFFLPGIYTGFDQYKTDFVDGDHYNAIFKPISVPLKVLSNYGNQHVTLSMNGSYNLADVFNIPERLLRGKFTIGPDDGFSDPSQYQDYWSPSNPYVISGGKIGKFQLKVKNDSATSVEIPGLPNAADPAATAIVYVDVSDTFSLNISEVVKPVGSSDLQLYGLIGSNEEAGRSQFEWDAEVWKVNANGSKEKVEGEDAYKYISIDPVDQKGRYAQITTLKETVSKNYVIRIGLRWTDSKYQVWYAHCDLTIKQVVTDFKISPNEIKLHVGGSSERILSNITGDFADITWTSSDDSIVTVTPVDNTKNAEVAPAGKSGYAIITAVNKDTGMPATCIVNVTSDATELKIDKGEEYSTSTKTAFETFKVIPTPADATINNSTLKWSITYGEGSVVKFAENGINGDTVVLEILGKGEAMLFVETTGQKENVTAKCKITVKDIPITGITVEPTELTMTKGKTEDLKLTVSPADASDPSVTWTSFDEAVATVDGKGTVTAVGPGVTQIQVQSVADPSKQAIVKVTVVEGLAQIAFAEKTASVPVNGTKLLTVLFSPDEPSVNKSVTFTSSDQSIVTVDAEGNITGVSEGIAMITVVSNAPELAGKAEGLDTCLVTVLPEAIVATEFAIDPPEKSVAVNKTFEITPIFTPEDTYNKDVTYVSMDTSIAMVTAENSPADDKGGITVKDGKPVTVTGISEGTVWIQCTAVETGFTATCKVTVTPEEIVATEFTIDPLEAEVEIQKTFEITPIFTPENTLNKAVTYKSMDPAIATVSAEEGIASEDGGLTILDGKPVTVTGVSYGTVWIQCTAVETGIIANCKVTVVDGSANVTLTLSPTEKEIVVGKTFTIKKTVLPETAKSAAKWTSSNENIAVVSSKGKVTTKNVGTAIITCKLTGYQKISATCKVKVVKVKTSLSLNKTSIRINVGQTYRLQKTVTTNNTSVPKVEFTSKNKKVATVGSTSGKVTGKKVGSTIIVAKTTDKVHATARCRVIVIRRATGISLNKTYAYCYIGKTLKLKATIKPSDATVKTVRWTTSDDKIADVIGGGKVTGYAEGEVYITATTTDGSNKYAKCLVKVTEEIPASSIMIAQSDLTMKKGDTTKITYNVLPANTTDTVKLVSDNKRVVTVNGNKITAVGTGNAVVTLMSTNGATTTVNVNVVALNKNSMVIRQYDTETLLVQGTSDNITWYSANNRIATVSGGVVTGRGLGTTYIYAFVNGCKMGCKVQVVSVNAK